jgi:hypothetical protein
MESGGEQRMRKGTGTVYRIVVRSELSKRYARAFHEMEMEIEAGQTILTGELVDQSHLYGLIDRIGALALDLVRVESVPTEERAGGPYQRQG